MGGGGGGGMITSPQRLAGHEPYRLCLLCTWYVSSCLNTALLTGPLHTQQPNTHIVWLAQRLAGIQVQEGTKVTLVVHVSEVAELIQHRAGKESILRKACSKAP